MMSMTNWIENRVQRLLFASLLLLLEWRYKTACQATRYLALSLYAPVGRSAQPPLNSPISAEYQYLPVPGEIWGRSRSCIIQLKRDFSVGLLLCSKSYRYRIPGVLLGILYLVRVCQARQGQIRGGCWGMLGDRRAAWRAVCYCLYIDNIRRGEWMDYAVMAPMWD